MKGYKVETNPFEKADSSQSSPDFQQLLAQRWPDISRRAADRATLAIIRKQRFEQQIEYVNMLLLTERKERRRKRIAQ